jgi:hypothetical protein
MLDIFREARSGGVDPVNHFHKLPREAAWPPWNRPSDVLYVIFCNRFSKLFKFPREQGIICIGLRLVSHAPGYLKAVRADTRHETLKTAWSLGHALGLGCVSVMQCV